MLLDPSIYFQIGYILLNERILFATPPLPSTLADFELPLPKILFCSINRLLHSIKISFTVKIALLHLSYIGGEPTVPLLIKCSCVMLLCANLSLLTTISRRLSFPFTCHFPTSDFISLSVSLLCCHLLFHFLYMASLIIEVQSVHAIKMNSSCCLVATLAALPPFRSQLFLRAQEPTTTSPVCLWPLLPQAHAVSFLLLGVLVLYNQTLSVHLNYYEKFILTSIPQCIHCNSNRMQLG